VRVRLRRQKNGRHAALAKVALQANIKTPMSYITDFETELSKKLASSETSESIVRWVSERLLQSYKNGIIAGRKGETAKGQEKSRSPGSVGKAE